MKILPLPLIVFVLTLLSCSDKKNIPDNQLRDTQPVSVSVAHPRMSIDKELYLSGHLESAQNALISTRVMGYVTKIYTQVGQHVTKGQLLVSISQQDIIAQAAQVDAGLREAQANLLSAQKDYERFVRLYDKGSATEKELQNVTLAYESAKSKVQAAKEKENEVQAMMTYVNLRAPFSGIVTQKFVDEGGISTPGMAILALENPEELQVQISVPEIDIEKIKQGEKVIVHLKSNGTQTSAVVQEVSSSSKYSGGQYIVKARLLSGNLTNLYSGMYVNVVLPIAHSPNEKMSKMYIPLTSIIQKDQLTGVFVVLHNTAVLRWIRVGKIKGEYVEVLSGLDARDQYIVNPSATLSNGTLVKYQ